MARVLNNGELTVEVMDPNDPARYNRGSRFSPVANVLRVVRDGKDFLFSPVAHDPVTENCGLAMEFDITTDGGPPGFAEAALGEAFLKIGVGVLRKTEAEYHFIRPCEMIEPATTTVTWGEDRADFEQACAGVNGYAYKLSAKVQLQAATVVIWYRLTNTGSRNLVTEQYAHNYFAFDGAPVGSNYEVRLPYDFEASGMGAVPRREGCRMLYEQTLGKPVNLNVPLPQSYVGPNTVTVSHVGKGQAIAATTTSNFGTRTFLHATTDYLCPEQFVRLSLKPGESGEWKRQYEILFMK